MRHRPEIAILCGGGLTHAAGGIGQLSAYLLDAWAASRWRDWGRTVVDTRGDGGSLSGIVSFTRAAARLATLSLSGRLDLLHANMSTRGSAVRKCLLCRAAQLVGTPTVMHMHGADLHEFYRRQARPFRAFMRASLRRSSCVIVLGTVWRDFMVDEVGVPAERVAVVPNGVPAPAPARARAEARDGVRIVLLGRLGDRKGVPELLAALARPELRARCWQATLAGDGELERFRTEAAALGLDGRVAMPGWVDRPAAAALLDDCDLFVLPSHHEGMPLALLEALARGVPAIATPVGSNTDFLVHGQNALLVPPGDDAALADALGRLIDDPALRRRLGDAGRATFRERLDIGTVAERIAEIHAEALRMPIRRGRPA